MRVAILGVGTVGEEVANALINNSEIIASRAGEEIKPVIGVVRDLNKQRNAQIPLTNDINSVIDRNDIDVYVELMGGIDEPFRIIKNILLNKKKAVATANKALLAYHRYEIQDLAKNLNFGFEASVAGGIPIIKALKEGLSANKIQKIVGILNGTSNYILTDMMKYGSDFKEILTKAQNLGYAEADPTFDIGGFDAAHKLLILSSIAFGVPAKPEDILIKGIERISSDDIYFAKDFDYSIKLLAIAKRQENGVEMRVHPTLVSKDNIIAKVDGVMNAVYVNADLVGESLYYGPGAGGKATASAVISDLIDIARKSKNPLLGYKLKNHGLNLLSKDEIKTKYYFRLKVADRLGVLANITNIMCQNGISIDNFLQKPKNKGTTTTLYFTTHTCFEKDVKKAHSLLTKQDYVIERPFLLRIEN